jgi:outer membrane protein, multidrug efflux system
MKNMNFIRQLLMKRTFVVFWAALLLGGCAVGPTYHRPAPFGTNVIPAAFSETWKVAQPSANLPRGAWWEIFGDADLNRLEILALTNNQQLVPAVANFQQARALVKVSRADYFPQLSLDPSAPRQRTSANAPGGPVTRNNFTLPLDASWEWDLFGRVRRQVEGSRARMIASADDLESLRLSIEAEIAIDYFTLQSLNAQIQLLESTAVTFRRSLKLTQDRHESGIATELDVAEAETQLRAAEAQIPAFDLQRSTLRHALATLCGQPATTFNLSTVKTTPNTLPDIPISLPSKLLESRPDIAAAERRMAAANADVGVANAAFYPSITLNGLAGFQSIDSGSLFNWESRLWSVGPSLQLPLFTGGRNRAQLAASRAAYEATVANYRQTVLSAFQDVEDQLAAQRLLASQFDAENAALKSARRTLEISMTRYQGGVITYLEVSTAQSASLAHEQTVVQLRASRLTAAVSLVKALGAGWETTATAELKTAGK